MRWHNNVSKKTCFLGFGLWTSFRHFLQMHLPAQHKWHCDNAELRQQLWDKASAVRSRKTQAPTAPTHSSHDLPIIIFIHVHSFSFIFIHFHSFSFIFIHFHHFQIAILDNFSCERPSLSRLKLDNCLQMSTDVYSSSKECATWNWNYWDQRKDDILLKSFGFSQRMPAHDVTTKGLRMFRIPNFQIQNFHAMCPSGKWNSMLRTWNSNNKCELFGYSLRSSCRLQFSYWSSLLHTFTYYAYQISTQLEAPSVDWLKQ